MLEGRNINLRIAEKEDIPLLLQWFNNVRFAGDYQSFPIQTSESELELQISEHKVYGHEWVNFIVERKDQTRIGEAVHYISTPNFGWVEIGYAIIPEYRNKGYGTETIQVLIDCLFLTRDIPRIQAVIDKKNLASKSVLEKTGFKKEGMLRKALWNVAGKWTDGCIYSILRQEWKKPKMLTKSA